jgi:hypothetical protein
MNLENNLKAIRIACNIADWFSIEQHVDYDFDLSLGILFAEGRIVFYNGYILEFTESITPDRIRYRYHYMNSDGTLIFRYDNVPHYPEIRTFPHHKHLLDTVIESDQVNLRQVVEEVIEELILDRYL